MKTSDWLAIAALALSTFAFTATNLLVWLRWPRTTVDITGRTSCIITSGADGGTFDQIVVAVVNRGAEAVTIRSIGLAVAKMPDGSKLDTPNVMWDYEAAGTMTKSSVPAGPDMPARIEAHGVQIWKFSNEMLGMFPGGSEVIAYADRYKAFRFWPYRGRDIVTRHFSQRTAERRTDHVRALPQKSKREDRPEP